MARVLLIQPNRWGRGITSIWIPAHVAALRGAGHEVELFDATFHRDWALDETAYNTANKQYRPTDYAAHVTPKDEPVRVALQRVVDAFVPDVVFWSALSSHIHGEGEYVNVQYGHELIEGLRTTALRVAGGLQATAIPERLLERFAAIDLLIAGESDLVLPQLAEAAASDDRDVAVRAVAGTIRRAEGGGVERAPRQELIADMDAIGPYDYGIFEPQVLLRPYNGRVLIAVDYEMSRGCMFACSYCVETVVQGYYGFDEVSPRSGALRDAKRYLRHKSAARVVEELTTLHRDHGVELIRCQDTNFLTIDRGMLNELADRLEQADLDIRLYVETRVDRMAPGDFELLKRLQVDGVGTGLELASQDFREDRLRRFAAPERLAGNFARLRELGIKRTTYNIIGLPGETEAMILDTIQLNHDLDPDNMTVAFYSPYAGTPEALRAVDEEDFDEYETDVDGQMRTVSRSAKVDADTLRFYKAQFVDLVREGLASLDERKRAFGLEVTPCR